MYANDDLLPALPLPELKDTLRRLFHSAQPFAADGPSFYSESEFIEKGCAALHDAQRVLVQRSEERVNWLGDWWDVFAYLRSRNPVAIHTNIMAARLLEVSSFSPTEAKGWTSLDGRPGSSFLPKGWDDAVSRAALCIRESLHFRALLMREAVEEVVRAPPGILLCQQQFRKYYAMRVPHEVVDEVVVPKTPGDTEFAVVMFKGQMAFLRVATRGDEAPRLTLAEIRLAVRRAMALIDAKLRHECGGAENVVGRIAAGDVTLLAPHSVGLLTCAHRDEAAKGFSLLRSASPRNIQILDKLFYQTITVVSIDNNEVSSVSDALRLSAVANPHNRWFDRATSQIVSANGISMYQGEHSPMDAIVCAATPVEVVSVFACEVAATAHALAEVEAAHSKSSLPHAHEFEVRSVKLKRIDSDVDVCAWVIPQACRDIMVHAHGAHMAVASTCQFYALTDPSFGRRDLSKFRVHADFFFQLAIQMAYALDRNSPGSVPLTATYESASMRAFRQGRTETVRSATREMKSLIELLTGLFPAHHCSPVEEEHLRTVFTTAQRKHLQLVKEAATGCGIDRHLMGLQIAQTVVLQRPMPALLSDPALLVAQKFTLLTSQMVGDSYLGGFAHTLPEGYGVCYYPLETCMRACVSSCSTVSDTTTTSGRKTDAARFGVILSQCLRYLHRMVTTHLPRYDESRTLKGSANRLSKI